MRRKNKERMRPKNKERMRRKNKERMRPKKREFHELPYIKMVNSGTNRSASEQKNYLEERFFPKTKERHGPRLWDRSDADPALPNCHLSEKFFFFTGSESTSLINYLPNPSPELRLFVDFTRTGQGHPITRPCFQATKLLVIALLHIFVVSILYLNTETYIFRSFSFP